MRFTEFSQAWAAGYNKAKTGTSNSQEAVKAGAAESWRKYQEWKRRQEREREGRPQVSDDQRAREADPYTDPEWLIWVKGIGRALRRWLGGHR